MNQFKGVYRGKRVLVTGHTGFKGSWLVLWLNEMGAKVCGLALSPQAMPNHWDLLKLPIIDHRIDIRDYEAIYPFIDKFQPEIVFHLAAQPLVRRSYRAPLETWSTNVMGTANVLEACRNTSSVESIVIVTTDKCYQNREWGWGYREIDALGGYDPYSASKAGAEMVAASYRSAYLNKEISPLLATARAGNVIGGGDWSEDRLIPDLIRAREKKQSLEIRSPLATRPWQHVLESLSGYLLLGQNLLLRNKLFADAWNFGPDQDGNRTVSEILSKLNGHWESMSWHIAEKLHPHEANLLYLDSTKARTELGWCPIWDLDVTLKKTAMWYENWLTNSAVISHQQLEEYVNDAIQARVNWVEE